MTRRQRVVYLGLLVAVLSVLVLAPGRALADHEPGHPAGTTGSSSGQVDNTCGLVDFGCKAADAINDALVDLANKMVEAVGDATASLATMWMETPDPRIGDAYESGGFAPAPTVGFIEDRLYWFTLLLAVASVLYGAGRMAWEQRAAPARDLVASLIRLVLVGGAGLTFISIAIAAANGFSQWIIGEATDDFGASLVELLALEDADIALGAVILIMFVAFIALCASIGQYVLLVARNGFLIILAATWPTSAAATNTEQGRAMYQRHTSWLIAFILYKPVASIIYAAAFQTVANAGTSSDPVGQGITGFTLMILSLIALPALMRLVAPAVAAATSSGGGGGGMAALGAVAGGAAIRHSSRNSAGAAGAGSGGGGGGGSSRGGSTGSSGSRPPGGGGGGGRPAGGSPTGGAPSGGSGAAATGGGVGLLVRGAQTAQQAGNVTAKGAGAPPAGGNGSSNGGTP